MGAGRPRRRPAFRPVRLEQPAVDPHAAERLFVAGVQRGGQHEDRGLRRDAEFPGTDLPRDVEPGHVREAHVQQYGVGLQFADEVQGVLSAARHVRGISGLRQRFAEEQGRNRRIFSDHQPSARPRFCGAVRLGEGGGRSGARGGGRFPQAVRVGRQTEPRAVRVNTLPMPGVLESVRSPPKRRAMLRAMASRGPRRFRADRPNPGRRSPVRSSRRCVPVRPWGCPCRCR